MKLVHVRHVESHPVTMEGAQGCRVRWLVGQSDGAPNFAMREFEVAPGGHTPRHQHPYEHEVFVLEGSGVIYEGEYPHPVQAGDVVYIAADELHQFKNFSNAPFRFLCLVPHTAATLAQAGAAAAPECQPTAASLGNTPCG